MHIARKTSATGQEADTSRLSAFLNSALTAAALTSRPRARTWPDSLSATKRSYPPLMARKRVTGAATSEWPRRLLGPIPWLCRSWSRTWPSARLCSAERIASMPMAFGSLLVASAWRSLDSFSRSMRNCAKTSLDCEDGCPSTWMCASTYSKKCVSHFLIRHLRPLPRLVRTSLRASTCFSTNLLSAAGANTVCHSRLTKARLLLMSCRKCAADLQPLLLLRMH
mmetsp:Transcript_6633/g.14486  ORF Transcript_6633/g.14486 Transcript_6633/m.14486 type:complete len:224 (-) Transcript_6633:3611-4282(-)